MTRANPAYRKGAPALTYRPDRMVKAHSYGAEHTGTWRVGRITAVHASGSLRIIDAVDGEPVRMAFGDTLTAGETYAIGIGNAPRPLDLRGIARDLMGREWTDGAAARAAIEAYMEPHEDTWDPTRVTRWGPGA